jgi:transforming growth factor-beta-induced protein
MSSHKPQNHKINNTINSIDSEQIAKILEVEKQILSKESSIAATETYIAKRSSFINKIVMVVGFLTILSISLTGALISQNVENKNSQAGISYSCLSTETLSGVNCISDASSYPVYGEGCPTGYITMQSVCAKVTQKTCPDFAEAVNAEAGFCKIGDINNVLLSEVTDVDGRTCNGNGYNFKRYNVGFATNSTQGPIVCASAFSAVFGKANFRFIPQIVIDIQNFSTSQTGSKTVPCLVGYTAINNNTQCSRPATIFGCNAGGEYLGRVNIFGTVAASAETNTQINTVSGNNISTLNTNTTTNISSLSSSSLTSQSNTVQATKNIVQIASSNSNFSTLVTALNKAELVSVFEGSTKFTVLAPTNDAFAKIPAATLNLLLKPENKQSLIKLLKYHVLAGEVNSTQVASLTKATTIEGSDINISILNGEIFINQNSQVLIIDIQATNGIIHAIDDVLLPPDVDLTKLIDPTIASSSSSVSSPSSLSSSSQSQILQTINQLAANNPNLSTLVTALTKADLATLFSGSTKFTVLAPTNDAFAKIPASTLNLLLKPENKDSLTKLLKYHVLTGEVKSTQISGLTQAGTVEGSNINIKVINGSIFINIESLVLTADIQAGNGIIHTIDDVLLPPSLDLTKLIDNSKGESIPRVNPTNLSCKPCPAGQFCPNNSTGATTIKLCVNGGTLNNDKCIAQNKISQTVYTDGCSSEYIKLDQSCAIIEVRTHDLGCTYYYASDNVNVLSVLSDDGVRCSTGGRTDFESTSIVKVSDLQCDGPDSAYYNYNVAYDPLVCGKGNPANKAAFRWSQNSFTKITGLQKLGKNTSVCPATWISLNDNECYQLVSSQEYKAKNDCPFNTYCPEGSTAPIPCPINTTSPSKSTKLSDCVSTPSTGGGVIIISTTTSVSSSSSSVSSSSQSIQVTTTQCVSKPGEYLLKIYAEPVCSSCNAGYYCLGGNNAPIICPVGYYCPPASANPTQCPVGTTTIGLGSKVLDDCKAIAKPAITVVRTGGLQVFIAIFSTLSLIFFGYIYLSSKNTKGGLNQGWSKVK